MTSPQGQKKRVLIVEDQPETQRLLQLMLQSKYAVRLSATVDEALALVREETFDLLLVDINLSEQNTGVDFLKQVRGTAGWASVPAVACTAYAMPGDRSKLLEEGFDGYVSKPFTRRELEEALEAVLEDVA
ncbi:MAG: response regulator [Bacteroidetes bacterium]|nr:response regulator [Bacteroidota bacterium]